jgi:hypothetical protein
MLQTARSFVAQIALGMLAVAVIALCRARLLPLDERVHTEHDIYALPGPSQLVTLSLGYRSALADLIFSHVLVSSGIHIQERRQFEFVDRYLDAINTLDPTFRDPYRYADTLLVVQAHQVPTRNYYQARTVLRRGLAQFPLDTELWATAGEFLAYLAPTVLAEPAEQEAFRQEGARMLAHACELVSGNAYIPHHCISAARLLGEAGQREAALKFLERVLAVNDDPEIRAIALGYIDKLLSASEAARIRKAHAEFARAWGADLPFVTRNAELVLGPPWDVAACAGSEPPPACVSSWRAWREAADDASPQGAP